MPEKLFSGKRARHLRHLGERERQDRRAAQAPARDQALDVHLELERVGVDHGQRGKRVRRDDRVGAATENRASLHRDVARGGRELGPHRHLGDLLYDLGHERAQLLVLADVRAHVLAVHVRAGQVELEPVGARVLAGAREVTPVVELLVAAGAGHDRGDQHAVRVGLLDPLEARDPPVERLVGDELPVPRRVQHALAPAVHGQDAGLGLRARELGLGALHVDDRVHPDRLGDDAAPARLEGAQDVALRLGRRRRGQQERVGETDPREGDSE